MTTDTKTDGDVSKHEFIDRWWSAIDEQGLGPTAAYRVALASGDTGQKADVELADEEPDAAPDMEAIEAIIDGLADRLNAPRETVIEALMDLDADLGGLAAENPEDPDPGRAGAAGQKTAGDADELFQGVVEAAVNAARRADQPETDDRGRIVEPHATKRDDVDDLNGRKATPELTPRERRRKLKEHLGELEDEAIETPGSRPYADDNEPDGDVDERVAEAAEGEGW